MRFLSDPTAEGQQEGDVDGDDDRDPARQWRALLALLTLNTGTPEDCFFCLWDGWPGLKAISDGPKVEVTHRRYYIFSGSLCAIRSWDSGSVWPDSSVKFEPALIWPADHAWCLANDVDPHWAGVGADAAVTEQIVAHPDIDAVATDPSADQPAYR